LRFKTTLASFFLVLSTSSFALDGFNGKVNWLEPTYLPAVIKFTMDSGNSTCPAGTVLRWQKPDVENNKLVYSTLMAAMLSGKRVRFHFNDGDTACTGTHLHFLEN
jgi:hypothetical protein